LLVSEPNGRAAPELIYL